MRHRVDFHSIFTQVNKNVICLSSLDRWPFKTWHVRPHCPPHCQCMCTPSSVPRRVSKPRPLSPLQACGLPFLHCNLRLSALQLQPDETFWLGFTKVWQNRVHREVLVRERTVLVHMSWNLLHCFMCKCQTEDVDKNFIILNGFPEVYLQMPLSVFIASRYGKKGFNQKRAYMANMCYNNNVVLTL